MKRVLILTAGFGEGHNSAAKGLRNALARQGDSPPFCEVHDLFAECYGSASAFARKAYVGTINRAPKLWQQIYELIDRTDMVAGNLGALSRMRGHLEKLVDAFKPDAIASTYPLYGYLLDRIYRNRGNRNFTFFTIITDSISVNSVWTKCPSDWFLVANAETALVVEKMGVDSGIIKVLGFPVDPLFADFDPDKTKERAPDDPWRFLYMVNSGKRHAARLARRLASRKDILLTVTAGKDEGLKEDIEKAVASSANPAEVIGWSDEIPRLLSRSHCLIGKAGGATVQETLAAACPMIITQVVPGQEEGNAELIERNHCGCVSEDAEEGIPRIVASITDNDGKQLLDWLGNIRDICSPAASMDIAAFILENSRT